MSASVQSGARPHPSDQDSAASAALKVTRDSPSKQKSNPILDADGRLSAASAATSLKYARAQDLPSFPSQGGVKLASAGAAASLANDNQKTFEHWKPEALPAANKAALQAKDYKMEPLWQPELSAAGSKAALQAHGNTSSPQIWKASESEHGLSAAGQAHASRKAVKPITERDVSASDHRKALLAATGAMSGNRRRSGSAPIPPQTNTASAWALKAANSTHKANSPRTNDFSTGDPGFEAARVQNLAKNNVSRQMYGSAPPVAIEVEEKNRQDTLRASAIAMAKKMYAIQQSHIDDARRDKNDSTTGARVARNRALSDASSSYGSTEIPTRGYENLQEAATKLAQEKLAKLHDEHAEYRQYYGQTTTQPRSKLSMRTRRRASSLNENDDDSDEEQSRKIRSQMSVFNTKLAEVDTKKRQADRDALLQAAHKNVTAKLNQMDEKIFSETGKSSPQQRELWERQARERAQRESDERMINVGRVHIGGGKYLDQADIDAIARARLQPTLDDITDKAEKQRARDEEIRLEQERIKAEQEKEKQRQAEVKQELKDQQNRDKQEERARKAEEKRVQNEKSQAEKEKLRAEKEEKRKSSSKKQGFFAGTFGRGTGEVAAGGAAIGAGAAAATSGTASSVPATAEPTTPEPIQGVATDDAVEREAERPTTPTNIERETSNVTPPSSDEAPRSPEAAATTTSATEEVPASPTSPTSPSKRDSRVKSFFSRLRGKSQTAADFEDSQPGITAADGPTEKTTESSSKEDDHPRSDSMRNVALAGRTAARESSEGSDMYGDATERQAPDSPVSPVKDTKIHTAPVHFAATTDTAETRDRSASISSLSSSVYSDHQATTSTAAHQKHHHEAPPKPSTEAARTIDSEESRGRPGFRQRLISKVKTPSKLSKINKSAVQPETNTSPTVPRPVVETNASDWGAETEGALAAGNSNSIINNDDAVDVTASRGKKSQDTEEQEREEARDSFKEETLSPPGTADSSASAAKRSGQSPVASPVAAKDAAGSRFVEDL